MIKTTFEGSITKSLNYWGCRLWFGIWLLMRKVPGSRQAANRKQRQGCQTPNDHSYPLYSKELFVNCGSLKFATTFIENASV